MTDTKPAAKKAAPKRKAAPKKKAVTKKPVAKKKPAARKRTVKSDKDKPIKLTAKQKEEARLNGQLHAAEALGHMVLPLQLIANALTVTDTQGNSMLPNLVHGVYQTNNLLAGLINSQYVSRAEYDKLQTELTTATTELQQWREYYNQQQQVQPAVQGGV